MKEKKQDQTAPELNELQQSDRLKSSENSKQSSKVEAVEKTTEDTPFTLICAEGKWHITIGETIVGDRPFDSKKEAESYINSKPWKLILVATAVFYDKMQEQIKKHNNQ